MKKQDEQATGLRMMKVHCLLQMHIGNRMKSESMVFCEAALPPFGKVFVKQLLDNLAT